MSRGRILIVEDEGITARDIGMEIEKLGYEVAGMARSGTEALEKAAEQRPDLVLMDIRLDGALDGIETAARLHDEMALPVTYLTAHADPETLRRACRTAPYGYVVKPFERQELEAAISVALERRRQEQDLESRIAAQERLAETLRRHNRAKSDMLAVLAHEIRSPLQTCFMLTELLNEGEGGVLSPRQARHVEILRRKMFEITEVMRTTLELARLDQRPTLRDVDLTDLLSHVAAELEDYPRSPDTQVRWHVEDPLRLRTDPDKLRIVVKNLVGNAIKSTERGQVDVRARATGEGVELSVRDTGGGIAPEEQEQIFEPFHRGRERTASIPGVGLGLYVTRRMVDLLGGRIGLESTPGEGTTFRVHLLHRPRSEG